MAAHPRRRAAAPDAARCMQQRTGLLELVEHARIVNHTVVVEHIAVVKRATVV
jgi:hypothetical protein